MLLEADLALAGRRQFDVFIGQDFGTAVLMHPDCCNHDNLLKVGANSADRADGLGQLGPAAPRS